MIILLDMDGPLADFDTRCWKECWQRGWETDITYPREQTRRYFTDHMPNAREAELMRDAINTPGWFTSLKVTTGATVGAQGLLGAGHEVWVATKALETNPTCRDEKVAWLREHFPYLEDRMFITPDKSLLRGDILLDDAPKPKWLKDAVWQPVIFDATYNGAGTVWSHLPRWTWGDPVSALEALVPHPIREPS